MTGWGCGGGPKVARQLRQLGKMTLCNPSCVEVLNDPASAGEPEVLYE